LWTSTQEGHLLVYLIWSESALMDSVYQRVSFTASPCELFAIYLDSKKHGAAIDDTVTISRKLGARFTAFGGMLQGRNLMIVPNRMIVQSWRGNSWRTGDADSILILLFSKAGRGGQIELIQANVPVHTYARIKNGWPKHYWVPGKAYLKNRHSR
jgi:activator of HSP90 ATPase